jgi:hypothetical protein
MPVQPVMPVQHKTDTSASATSASETFMFVLAGFIIFILISALVGSIIIMFVFAIRNLPPNKTQNDLELGTLTRTFKTDVEKPTSNCTTTVNITESKLNFYRIHNFNSAPKKCHTHPHHHSIIEPSLAEPVTTTRADVNDENCHHMHHTIDSEIKEMTKDLVSFKKKKKEKNIQKKLGDQEGKNETVKDSDSFDSNNPFKDD